MVLRNLRIICIVMTGILIVSFWVLVWAPVSLEYLFGDVGETPFFLSFLALGAALLGFLGWVLTGVYKTVSLRSVEKLLLVLVGGNLLLGGVITVPAAMVHRSYGSHRALATGEGIRAALEAYVADNHDNLFPKAEHIRDYTTLRALVNQQGGTLPESEAKAGFRFVSYAPLDTDNDGLPDSYVIILIPRQAPSWKVIVTPGGVERIEAQ